MNQSYPRHINFESVPHFRDLGYRALHQQMLVNQLLTPYFEERHGLELRLGRILDESRSSSGLITIDLADPQDYALFSFTRQWSKSSTNSPPLRDGLNTDLRPFSADSERRIVFGFFEGARADLQGSPPARGIRRARRSSGSGTSLPAAS